MVKCRTLDILIINEWRCLPVVSTVKHCAFDGAYVGIYHDFNGETPIFFLVIFEAARMKPSEILVFYRELLLFIRDATVGTVKLYISTVNTLMFVTHRFHLPTTN